MRRIRPLVELLISGPVLVLIVASVFVGLLTGCSASFSPGTVTPEQTPIGNIQGAVHGGNLPVTGAQIYLFAAGQGGYGTSATSLMKSGSSGVSCSSPVVSGACYVTTDGNGDFAVGGDYTCTQGQAVYMVAVGGNPGLTATPATTTATFSTNSSTITVASATGINIGMTVTGTGVGGTVTAVSGTTVTLSQKTTAAGTNQSVTFSGVNNTGAVQMAALGTCPAAGSMASLVPYLVINEVTTVAFAYSAGGFATTAYNVSSDSTGTTAVGTAFANANNIVTLGDGQANGQASGNSNSVAPQTKINALANILSTCVNTTAIASTQCMNLFKYATTSTGTVATDESNAMFNIVHNQTENVTSIWNLSPTTPVFSPALTTPPTDWTMPVIYKGVISTPTASNPITTGPYNIAFDVNGNAWIGDRTIGVVEIGAQGALTTYGKTAYGFGMVKGVAVSPEDGSIWVSDFDNDDIYVMSATGTKLSAITQDMKNDGPILTAFASNPAGGDYLAFEATETSPSIIVFDAGTYAADKDETSSNYGNVEAPGWITVDNTGSSWIPSTGTTWIGGLAVEDKSGTMKYTTSQTNVGATYQTVAEAEGAASDGLGNVWAPSGAVLYEVNAGNVMGGYTGGGMSAPSKTFIDGGNVVWVSSSGANTVSALKISSGAWLSSAGFATSAASGAGSSVIGVDPSGNVWSGNSDQSVTELLGLGTPTAAPLYAGNTVVNGGTTVTKGNLGTEP
jgi:hypothetical protein